MQFKFLLVDIETMGVLCITDSVGAANSIAQGIFNVKVSAIPMYIFWTKPKWKDLNFDTDYLKFDDTNGPEITQLDSHLITDDFINKRKLSILRRKFLIKLESSLNIVMFKTVVGFDSNTLLYIENQLAQTDIENNIYPDSILEYAQYSGIKESQAYRELKMLTESQGRMRLRLFACYTKYSNKINECKVEQEMAAVYEEAVKDIFINARL